MGRQYEKNIGKPMSIKNFGTIKGKPVKMCILKMIQDIDGMCYFIDLYTSDMEYLGGRWLTRHMYRYHVLDKPY